jgi:two-component system, NtrC family, sensor kinase
MTLRRKMTLQIGAMLVALLLVGAAAVWGLNGLRQDYGVALEGYQRLRQVYEASSHLKTAQRLLRMHAQTLGVAREEVSAAVLSFEQRPPPGAGWDPEDVRADAAVRSALRELAGRMDAPSANGASPEQVAAEAVDSINDVLARIPTLVAGIRRTTESRQAMAQNKRRATVRIVAALAAAAVVAGLALGAWQYRSVMRPLRQLGAGVRRVAAGQFRGGVEPHIGGSGGDEFAALAGDFNRMAAELDGLYRDLEQKVAAKSRELIRSERLASVGYLAAGVAHEINNPLGIISGYAEYSLSELRERAKRAGAAAASRPGGSNGAPMADGEPCDEVEKSLRVICDEAFRCKEITGKLLSLARPGEENRAPVSLAEVARQVASIVGGLQQFRDRRVTVAPAGEDAFTVRAVEAEMKQVLLNLTLNALEAVPPGTGEVRVELRRDHSNGNGAGWVELAVADNGRGMSPQTLERVFEPFFTEKRGAREAGATHGTGLGLSITHAIVQSHGGRVEAFSEGIGMGSRFVLRLPAWEGTRVEDGG